MVQLDSLLSQFAGVISGFDLGDEVGPQSLGFGSSSSAVWMQQTSATDGGAPGVDKGGNIFSLTLLGQYAANFSAGADGHGGNIVHRSAGVQFRGSDAIGRAPLRLEAGVAVMGSPLRWSLPTRLPAAAKVEAPRGRPAGSS